MHALRLHLPRFAALVLLLWVFATGVAFAHACQAEVDLACDECCVEMKAAASWSETRTVTVAAAQDLVAPPRVTAIAAPLWHPTEAGASRRAAASDPGGHQPIPIVFLRLAL